uniref:Uncharacterized protein n=1 Tax=Rhizophora mucronata TaxID=61149 RepID=A0A2P2PFB0_RHIMU
MMCLSSKFAKDQNYNILRQLKKCIMLPQN